MTMKKLLYMFAAVAALSTVSCVKENFNEPEGGATTTFYGKAVDVKTAVVDGHTVWTATDNIKVFYDNTNVVAELKTGENTSSATFEAAVGTASDYYAVYPASETAAMADGVMTVTLPATQNGLFGAGHVAVAKAEDKTFTFTNVNAFLKMTFASAKYTRIVVESVGGQALAGDLTVTFADGAAVIGSTYANTSSTVEVTSETAFPAGDLYISVLPGITHANGILVSCYNGAEKVGAYLVDKPVITEPSVTLTFDVFEPNGNYYVTAEGAGNNNGLSLANAMPVAKMVALIQKSANDAAAKAAVNGAVFHFAAGEYELAEQALNLSYTGEPVKLTFKAEGEVAFSGNDAHTIMVINGADVTLEGIKVVKSVAKETLTGAFKVSGANSKLTLKGCSVIENYVEGDKITCSCFALSEGASLTATDCSFIDNTAYSAPVLYVDGANVNMTGCRFEGNYSAAEVGVMLLKGDQESNFTNCEVIDNHAWTYGMIQHVAGNTTFTNCDFKENAVNTGSGKYPGVLQLDSNGSGKVTIIGGECSGNEAGSCGVVNQEATGAELVMTDVVIKDNYGTVGDGAIWSAGKCTLTRCTLSNNTSGATDKTIGQSLTISGQEFAMYGCVIENTTGKKSSNAVAITGDARVTIGSDSEGNRSVIRNNSADWGGAVTLSGTSEAVIYDTDIIGNHAKGAGAFRVVDNTSLTLTDCVLKNNYTTGGNGGALAFESTENCYCNRCHFEGNGAQNDGGAIKVDRSGSIVFLNACTFKGNYNQAKPAGTTIQINNNGYFAMNNCTIADDTYSETGNADMPVVSWLSFDQPDKMWFSNNTFIGVPRLNGELTNGGLVRIWFDVETEAHFVNNIVVTDEQENVWSFCQLDKTIGKDYTPSVCLYHTKYSEFENVSACESMITFMENPTSSGFSKNSFGDLAWNADKCYWSWNGTMTSGANKNMITASQFIATLDNVMPEFKTWLMSVDGLYKDQLGNSRGNGAWWPGSYQGAEEILGGDFGNVEIPKYDEEDILADM